jgi:hypothetical protein
MPRNVHSLLIDATDEAGAQGHGLSIVWTENEDTWHVTGGVVVTQHSSDVRVALAEFILLLRVRKNTHASTKGLTI